MAEDGVSNVKVFAAVGTILAVCGVGVAVDINAKRNDGIPGKQEIEGAAATFFQSQADVAKLLGGYHVFEQEDDLYSIYPKGLQVDSSQTCVIFTASANGTPLVKETAGSYTNANYDFKSCFAPKTYEN